MMMSCAHPIWVCLPYHNEERYMEVPCRKCLGCRKMRARTWAFRVGCELLTQPGVFVTLTYDDGVMPISIGFKPTLCKADVQKFIKRLRHKGNFKYYLAGEYGETTGRPHYHLGIIGKALSDQTKVDVQLCWKYGLTDVKLLTTGAALYVADYLSKATKWKYTKDQEAPFSLMSKNMGREWFEMHWKEIAKHPAMTDAYGRSIPLPGSWIAKIKARLSNQDLIDFDNALMEIQRKSGRRWLSKQEFGNERDRLLSEKIKKQKKLERMLSEEDRTGLLILNKRNKI